MSDEQATDEREGLITLEWAGYSGEDRQLFFLRQGDTVFSDDDCRKIYKRCIRDKCWRVGERNI